MKKLLVLMATLVLLPCVTDAGIWDSTKATANKAMFWKSEHLQDISFETIYPKKFYEKNSFSLIVTGTVVVGAGAFSYFTAGAGAPVAATGVSAVASWVAGGGAGSYMAGLSTIGGWFGGNAMLGAAILNGVSIGALGGATTSFGAMPILSKVGVMASVTASGLDGVFPFMNPETGDLEYKVRLAIPKNLGGKKTRNIVDRIYSNEDAINDAVEDDDSLKQRRLAELKQDYNDFSVEYLKKELHGNVKGKTEYNQEDLIVLSIIAWNNSEGELFDDAISKIDASKLHDMSFLNYLYALQNLRKGQVNETLAHLDDAIDEDPYAIEPYILYLNILGSKDFLKKEMKIQALLKKANTEFDDDKYQSSYSLASLYYRSATFYFTNKRFVRAQQLYQKAYDELDIFQKHFFGKMLRHTIMLGVANSLYMQKKIVSANGEYKQIIADIDSDQEKAQISSQYMGTKE